LLAVLDQTDIDPVILLYKLAICGVLVFYRYKSILEYPIKLLVQVYPLDTKGNLSERSQIREFRVEIIKVFTRLLYKPYILVYSFLLLEIVSEYNI
jgi:hypothetical protein